MATELEGRRLTYAELNARAEKLARHLVSLGAGPEVRVAVCLERSLEMVVALLGVLKAGSAYVPLDPSYPVDRLAHMLTDGSPRLLVTQKKLLPTLPTPMAPRVVCLDSDWPGA